ncbi:MAG: hypothetical protein JXA99_02385 [Candidatus Lokiarchaeota archaeon]|nr:hypothetical protein [Candidatus Lokiarchaeota archaeon]
MELFNLLEIITEMILAIMSIIVVIFIESTTKKQNKIMSLFFIQVAVLCFGLFNISNSLSIIFNNEIFSRLTGMLMFPCVFFMIIAINYSLKDSYFSNSLLAIIALGSVLTYLGFQPNSVYFDINNNIYRWSGAFLIITGIFNFINPLYLLLWGIRTWRDSPYSTKRESIIFLSGHVIFTIGAVVFLTLYLFEAIFIVIANISLTIGLCLMIVALTKDPRILSILPIQIYRIIVKDRNGNPLYDFNWSDYNIRENIFTGFLNAVQMMSEEIMNIGGVLNITLEEGILNLNESDYVTVAIVASKSSKSLRESLINFTHDFESLFKRNLKISCIDKNDYKSAYLLVKKHFSNYSTRFIKSKNSPIYLSHTTKKELGLLETKIKNIITDNNEFQSIKEDILKTPISFNKEFLELYEELKDESEESIYKIPLDIDLDLLD